METLTIHTLNHTLGQTTTYYTGGPATGIPIFFIHGWPDIAQVWYNQLAHFTTQNKYRVIAPDMRGYGDSSAPAKSEAYALSTLVGEMAELAASLDIEKAVWVGHDWGVPVVSSMASHHPELVIGMVALAVPYRSVEMGLLSLKDTINRDIYPEEEYEWGQWDYQRFYETDTEKSIRDFEAVDVEKITKSFYVNHDPTQWGKRAPGSRITNDGGWFGGDMSSLPDIPLEATSLDNELYTSLARSHRKHGWFPPTAWYLNHAANEEYAKLSKNGGVLEMPVLFIDARHDAVLSPSVSPKLGERQREFVKNLTEVSIESAHWVQLEKPAEVNEAIDKWLQGLEV